MPISYRQNIAYAKPAERPEVIGSIKLDSLGRVYTPRPSNWTEEQYAMFRQMAAEGMTSFEISTALGRPVKKVRDKARLLGIKLARPA